MKSILIALLILPVALSVLFACGFELQAESQKPEKGEVALRTQATAIVPTKTVVAAVVSSKPVVSVHVKHSIIGPGDKQTVYVQVTDQEGRGLADTVVNLTIQGTGVSQRICAQSTDALGRSACTFVVPNLAAGSPVFVDASVAWQGQQIKARTSYITW